MGMTEGVTGGDLPACEIVPIPYGRWTIRSKRGCYLTFSGKLSYTMQEVATYDTYQEALDDAKHLGLEL